MADRQALVLEKAELVKQVEGLLGDLPKTTQASIDPLNKRIKEINDEIVADVEAENVEACPA